MCNEKLEYQPPTVTKLEPVGEAEIVTNGVTCQVLQNPNDRITKDWGLIKLRPGASTPQQLVFKGKRVVESWLFGDCELIVRRASGQQEIYDYPRGNRVSVSINVGDIMKWRNEDDKEVILLETVWPAFDLIPDRFETVG